MQAVCNADGAQVDLWELRQDAFTGAVTSAANLLLAAEVVRVAPSGALEVRVSPAMYQRAHWGDYLELRTACGWATVVPRAEVAQLYSLPEDATATSGGAPATVGPRALRAEPALAAPYGQPSVAEFARDYARRYTLQGMYTLKPTGFQQILIEDAVHKLLTEQGAAVSALLARQP